MAPTFTAAEARTRATFLALMNSLSHPGRVYNLPQTEHSPFGLIGETLLDLETSFYTPDEALSTLLTATGARALAPERAAYHFYSFLTDEWLEPLGKAPIGTQMYPDAGATLVIGCTLDRGAALHLSGPGIPPQQAMTLRVTEVPTAFWDVREQTIRYPRGWDIFLVDAAARRLVGLPRTTHITSHHEE